MAYALAVFLTRKTMMLGIDINKSQYGVMDVHNANLELPACVVLNIQQDELYFGDDALKKMKAFTADKMQETQHGYRSFRPFEDLDKIKTKNDLVLFDEEGEPFDALKLLKLLFTAVLTRFRNVGVPTSLVCHSVIIVPQSWSSVVKECIFEAAKQAQMSNVMILNDTEAVATLCQIELQEMEKEKLNNTKHLIINWGGVFTEVTTMQMKFDETTRIDFYGKKTTNCYLLLFQELLAYLCSARGSFKLSCQEDEEEQMNTLIRKLQNRKNEKTLVMQLPENYTPFHPIEADTKQGVFLSGTRIRVDSSIFSACFDSLASDILSIIENLLGKRWKDEIGSILLFGDLSRIPLAIMSFKQILQVPVHLPRDPSVSVLRGALCFARRPEIGISRIIRSTVQKVDGSDFIGDTLVIENYNVVAAFDFGTTYSGYAYAFIDEPDTIHLNLPWSDGGNFKSLKTSTAILLNPAKEFDSFGFRAERKYAILIDEEEHNGWMLFRRFKMMLHDTGENILQRQTLLEDIDGKTMPAIDIFSMAIRYLRDQMLEAVCNAKTGILENTVYYVITVPAIWSDAAKQFMKEAAIKAGIDDDRILLALEPEAAAVWCQHIDTDIGGTKVGTQFMVADIGGGTTDISVQEKTLDGRLEEIFRPEGWAWGGTNVDKAFLFWMEQVFGGQSITELLRMRSMDDYFDLLNKFELMKREVMPSQTLDKMRIKLPAILTEICKDLNIAVGDQLNKLAISDKVRVNGDKLLLEGSIVIQWFSKTIENISVKMMELLQKRALSKVEIIILVGGFAESKLLQHALKNRIQNDRILIPPEAGVAVLKGAVKYGQRTGIIVCRVVKSSYGIKKTVGFKTDIHDVSHRTSEDGLKVVHLFEKFVAADTKVKIGERISKGFEPTQMDCTVVEIFSSSAKDPTYIAENGCKKLGQIKVKHTSGKELSEKMFDIIFEFGRTEIIVMAKMRRSGQEFRAKLDCI